MDRKAPAVEADEDLLHLRLLPASVDRILDPQLGGLVVFRIDQFEQVASDQVVAVLGAEKPHRRRVREDDVLLDMNQTPFIEFLRYAYLITMYYIERPVGLFRN